MVGRGKGIVGTPGGSGGCTGAGAGATGALGAVSTAGPPSKAGVAGSVFDGLDALAGARTGAAGFRATAVAFFTGAATSRAHGQERFARARARAAPIARVSEKLAAGPSTTISNPCSSQVTLLGPFPPASTAPCTPGASPMTRLVVQTLHSDATAQAAASAEPAVLAKYTFNLAKGFNLFYHRHRIIAEENEVKRVVLIAVADYTRRQLTTALATLGVSVPERM